LSDASSYLNIPNRETFLKDLDELIASREQEEKAGEDTEIADAVNLITKFQLASKRHDDKVMKPLLQNLLFGLGDRFPHEGVLLALDKVFNGVRWPRDRESFLHPDYLKDEVMLLKEHFGQPSTSFNKASCIDPSKIETEWAIAKVQLYTSYGVVVEAMSAEQLQRGNIR